MGVSITILCDIDPMAYHLDEVALHAANSDFKLRSANLINVRVGETIVWEKVQRLWYDLYLKDKLGKKYVMKGFYLDADKTIKLTDILNSKLPMPY